MRGEAGLDGNLIEDDPSTQLEGAQSQPLLTFENEKDIAGTKVVVYRQTVMGLDVFGARLGMSMDGESLTMTSLQSSVHGSVMIENPTALSRVWTH